MKPRRVVVAMEMVTDAKLDALRKPIRWNDCIRARFSRMTDVIQVQANVIQEKKKNA